MTIDRGAERVTGLILVAAFLAPERPLVALRKFHLLESANLVNVRHAFRNFYTFFVFELLGFGELRPAVVLPD